MPRALKSTLLIGLMVSLPLGLIHFFGLIRPLDAAIARALGLAGANLDHKIIQPLAFVGLAFGIAWTTIDINRPVFKCLVVGTTLAQVFTLAAVAALYGAYFSPVLPGAATVMSFIVAFLYARSDIGQRQRVADAAFGRRVSGEQMRLLVDGRTSLDDAGSLQELTLVVAEVFNHEKLMDALEPEQHAAVTNRVLNIVAEALVASGGTLTACDGEGVRAIFGAPLPSAEHAASACRAVMKTIRQVRALNEELARDREGLVCDVRVGVNSGEMAIGRFGSRRLGGFGVAGEETAFTRRLCAANLVYGTTILIGAHTLEMAEAAIEARPLELLRRRQGDAFLEVYELLGEPQDLSLEELSRRDLFWTGVIFFREKRLADAMEKFTQARSTDDKPDGPLNFYINRIRQLQNGKPNADYETTRLLNSL